MFRKLLKTIVPVSEIIFVLLQAYLLIRNRERYITSLVAAGYLQMTNPDNPTALLWYVQLLLLVTGSTRVAGNNVGRAVLHGHVLLLLFNKSSKTASYGIEVALLYYNV